MLPQGTVGESILGDLRQEFADRMDATGRRPLLWYWRQTLALVAFYAVGCHDSEPGSNASSNWQSLPYEARIALRHTMKGSGTTAMAVLILGLGIGANTAMFGVVHAVLLRPLSYARPEELVLFFESSPQRGETPMTEGNFADWRDHTSSVFETVTAFRSESRTLTGSSRPEQLEAMAVSANLLELTGVRPVVGQGFSPRDDLPGSEPTVLISYGAWRNRFGSDGDIVGKSLRLDGQPHRVVGVTPSSFLFPPPVVTRGTIREYRPEIYVPLAASRENRTLRGTFVAARLRRGWSISRARARLEPVIAELARQQPDFFGENLTLSLTPLREQGVSTRRAPLLLLSGSVGVILFIACMNVATLLLAEGQARRSEVALRVALGASQLRITRQLLVESLVLALMGGTAGIVMALSTHELVLHAAAGYLPLLRTVRIDTPVLLFALAVTTATSVVFGLAPALGARKPNLAQSLHMSFSKISSNPLARRTLRGVVAGQIALAVVLLVGAGLLLKSLRQLHRVDLGFKHENLLSFRMQLPRSKYADADQTEFVRRTMDGLRSLPSLASAAVVTLAPLAPGRFATNFDIEERRSASVEEARSRFVDLRQVSNGYFEALGLDVLDGRTFSAADDRNGPAVCILDSVAAQEHWSDGHAIGSEIILGDPDSLSAIRARVVGIVSHVPYEDLVAPRGTLYFPFSQQPAASFDILVRSRVTPERVAAEVRGAIAAVDPELALELSTFDDYLYMARARGRSPTSLLTGFAAMALGIALTGLYAVMRYITATRRKEFGIRVILGARPRQISRLLAAESGRMVGAGLIVGLCLAYGAARLMRSILVEVEPGDPWTFATVAAAFVGMAVVVSLAPTLRAARADPAGEIREA